MANKVFVAGVGITKFEKPFSKDWQYTDMAREAGLMALQDAGITYDRIEQACAQGLVLVRAGDVDRVVPHERYLSDSTVNDAAHVTYGVQLSKAIRDVHDRVVPAPIPLVETEK